MKHFEVVLSSSTIKRVFNTNTEVLEKKKETHPVCLTVGGFLEGVGSTEGEVLKRLM